MKPFTQALLLGSILTVIGMGGYIAFEHSTAMLIVMNGIVVTLVFYYKFKIDQHEARRREASGKRFGKIENIEGKIDSVKREVKHIQRENAGSTEKKGDGGLGK